LRFYPVKGSSQAQGLLALTREGRIDYKGVQIPLLHINDPEWKNVLFIKLIQQRQGKLYLPQNAKYDKVLREHLTSERLVERVKEGKRILEWVCRTQNNHISDCMKYAIAYKSLFEQYLQQPQQTAKAQPIPVTEVNAAEQPYYPAAVGWD
jgi:hypothetical protein